MKLRITLDKETAKKYMKLASVNNLTIEEQIKDDLEHGLEAQAQLEKTVNIVREQLRKSLGKEEKNEFDIH